MPLTLILYALNYHYLQKNTVFLYFQFSEAIYSRNIQDMLEKPDGLNG